jgi:uncharacterized protein YaaR (DUF327 family)
VKRTPATRADSKAASSGGGAPAAISPAIAEIIAEVDDSGYLLKNDPTGNTLERYKAAVQRLMDAAVADCMRLQTESSIGFSRKVFATISRIDMALSELADAVLARQQDVLKVATVVDQIKGLIVDLYR